MNKPSKASERRYFSQLKKIARTAYELIIAHVDEHIVDSSLFSLLSKYSQQLVPWATKTSEKMLRDANRQSDRLFMAQMKSVGKEYNRQLAESMAGQQAAKLLREQVELITSIPIKAGLRVQELAKKAAADGTRAEELAQEILRTNEVTQARAMLIARTEIGKATATFNQARAQSVGSEGYIWRTSLDGDVRDSHGDMEGQFVRWDEPPTLDGLTGHAGALPNCRCYAEIIV